ncbi:MAG: ribonuclease D [Sphingomonadaceae bacterium]|uniref:ribonuclease D n=1 Tax=Thermaurantiacus sp. TaxID=2820283 RepID=UPI00298ED394|nr:ribonuclease D [Thermaurantiacus sp.]MCS6985964.1 ribonuclease D [Sphingomonadaceae bacterium]MDW8414820.1 ribonuclease D [Thermaurantiacus sp.]
MEILPPVTDTATLAALMQRLQRGPFVAVDTEFIRENSYWPELCLIQVAGPDAAAVIDPLAKGIDLAPFLAMLADEAVVKVMHAASQDLEIFWNLAGRLPAPLFDTQVAAMALGLGEQVSYQHLVAHYTGQSIDKGARFTDWARRPLSPRQLDYAIGDVVHLVTIFPRMVEQLKVTGRGEWLDEEMARLLDPAAYRVEPDEAWRRLRLPNRKPEVLGRLKALARWRELEAMDKNVPRQRIAKDETLLDLATQPPASQKELSRVRGLSAAWETNAIGARLMAALKAAEPFELPPPPKPPPPPPPGAGLVADVLKLLLKLRAKNLGVAPRLIARAEDLEALAAGQREGLPLLEGWRREVFGEDALALVEGRVGFSIVNGELRMVPASGSGEARAEAPAGPPAGDAGGRRPPRKARPSPAPG